MNQRSSFPPAPQSSRSPSPRALSEKQVEALTVAMIVAPGVYARNRMFDLFSSSGARRARTRAAVVRGIVPQLARATAVTLSVEAPGAEPWSSMSGAPQTFVLRYVVAAVRLTRVVELSSAELAALRLIAERANVRALPFDEGDRDLVTKSLASLMDVDVDVSRLASGISVPTAE
ncbi:MAG TPA: hypothetical protein VM925_32535 [Labilithrix sp.]|nr:hypothetical protein [Labilithrix sp.]